MSKNRLKIFWILNNIFVTGVRDLGYLSHNVFSCVFLLWFNFFFYSVKYKTYTFQIMEIVLSHLISQLLSSVLFQVLLTLSVLCMYPVVTTGK